MELEIWKWAAIFAAGVGAGTINAVVGSGTLLTFPVLLAFGFPPVTANVSNTLGQAPGNLSAVLGFARELAGQRARVIRFGGGALLGGATGAALLLVLPPQAFRAIVPALIGLGVVLVLVGPRLSRALTRHRGEASGGARGGSALGLVALYGCGVYGGYFGAAQGVLLMGVLGLMLDDSLHRLNALKNVLAMCANAVAAVVFLFSSDVNWVVALLIAAGTSIGGQVGAHYGRKLHPNALRAIIVTVGLAALLRLLVP